LICADGVFGTHRAADYLPFAALQAASTSHAQIGLFGRSLPVPWQLAWSAEVSRAGEPHLVWQRQLELSTIRTDTDDWPSEPMAHRAHRSAT
jgi:hypothetical protein